MELLKNATNDSHADKWYIFKRRTHGLYGVQRIYTENGNYYRKTKEGEYIQVKPLSYCFKSTINAFETI